MKVFEEFQKDIIDVDGNDGTHGTQATTEQLVNDRISKKRKVQQFTALVKRLKNEGHVKTYPTKIRIGSSSQGLDPQNTIGVKLAT